MRTAGFALHFLTVLLNWIGSYSFESSLDGVLNLKDGKIFAIEWISPANKTSQKKALAVLTETQIFTVDPASFTTLYSVNHGLNGKESLVFRYIPTSNSLLSCSREESKNCRLFMLSKKNEFIHSINTDFGLFSYNEAVVLPVSASGNKNGSHIFLAAISEKEAFISQREIPKARGGVKRDKDMGLRSGLKNLYAFERQGFSYFLKNARIHNKSSDTDKQVLRLTRICNWETSEKLKSWMDISLSCGETDFSGGAAVYDKKNDRLVVGEEPGDENHVIARGRICTFHMNSVAAEFDKVWSDCQEVKRGSSGLCSVGDIDTNCMAYSHRLGEFCEPFGDPSELSRICSLSDAWKAYDYTHIESYRYFRGELFTTLTEGNVKALAEAEMPFVIFVVVKKGVAEYSVQRIIKSDSGSVVWEKAVKSGAQLSVEKPYWILASDTKLWGVDISCKGLYKECANAVEALKHGEPLGCGWCVQKDGRQGYSSGRVDCPIKSRYYLKTSCLPGFSEPITSVKDPSVLHIQGENLNWLNSAKTSVETCGTSPCNITNISNEKITCTLTGKFHPSCTVRVSFELEKQEFEVTLDGSPTTAPNIGGGQVGSLVYLAVGIIVSLAVVGFCVGVVIWKRRRRRKPLEDDGGSSILPLPVNGAGYLHPRGRMARNSYDGQPGQAIPMDLVPYEDLEFLVPENIRIVLNHLELANVVGEGHFGIVYKAIYKTPEGTDLLVAVKTLHAGVRGVREFLQEGIIMEHFNHPRVMSLIGISFTEANYPMIITPFMPKGDLLSYLREPSNTPNLRQLLKFAVEIGEGMQYLHKLKFIHRDLAARNCMLDERLGVKIADFGLCRDVYESGSYEPRHRDRDLPLRWMAPECIERQEYTFKGDVWSYGVVMWELMTRGAVPYHGTPGYMLLPFLKDGNLLPQPDYCPPQLYDVMCECWRLSLNDRPSFSQLCLTVPGVIQALETSLGARKSLEHHYYVNWQSNEVAAV